MRTFALVGLLALLAAGCGDGSSDDEASDETVAPATTEPAPAEAVPDGELDDDAETDVQRWPDVIDATARFDGAAWTISATLSSPYDTPERYADSWRVIGPDGTVYGERFLLHDHQNEQPFTRSQSGIEIPDGVEVVTIEGRDQVYGWGGDTFEVQLDRSAG